jgi:hypothetical protein
MDCSTVEVPLKKGWLKKQNRSGGIFSNWKERFFVLYKGKIAYYEEQAPKFPFGSGLKGSVSLQGAQLVLSRRIQDKNKIRIITPNEGQIVMDAGMNTKLAREWMKAIDNHIDWANNLVNSSQSAASQGGKSVFQSGAEESDVYASGSQDMYASSAFTETTEIEEDDPGNQEEFMPRNSIFQGPGNDNDEIW